jgi:hypothetical protein
VDEFDVQPPPFTALYFEVITSSPYSLDSYDVNDPIIRIDARYQENREIISEVSRFMSLLFITLPRFRNRL